MNLPTLAPPTVLLTIGSLGPSSTQVLRELLHARANEPGTHFVVDLRQMDDGHDMTLFALLAAKARSVTDGLGRMTAVIPSRRLSHLLATVGVSISRELPSLGVLHRLDVLSVGLLRD